MSSKKTRKHPSTNAATAGYIEISLLKSLHFTAKKFFRQIHIPLGTDNQGHPLMEIFRFNIEDTAAIVSNCPASSLFNHHGQGRGLIEQPQFAFGFFVALFIAGIEKDAALDQVTMKICHQGANIPQAVGTLAAIGIFQVVDEIAGAVELVVGVRLVDTVVE